MSNILLKKKLLYIKLSWFMNISPDWCYVCVSNKQRPDWTDPFGAPVFNEALIKSPAGTWKRAD